MSQGEGVRLPKSEKNSRATTKGENRFGTSSQFHTFPHFFPQDLLLKITPFLKRIKGNKQEMTKPFCTLVVAHLSSSNQRMGLTSGQVRGASGKVWEASREPLDCCNNKFHSERTSREVAGELLGKSPPCPSFPWSFRKHQGKPQKYQGFLSPCEPSKTL